MNITGPRRWALALVAALIAVGQPEHARAQESAEPCDAARLGELLLDLFAASPESRERAAAGLAVCRDPRSAGALAAVLDRDDRLEVRVASARALGQVGGETAAPKLEVLLASADESAVLKLAALDGLASLGAHGAIRELLQDQRAPDQLRTAALAALERVAPLEVPQLAALERDPSPAVAESARAALKSRSAETQVADGLPFASSVEELPPPVADAEVPPPPSALENTLESALAVETTAELVPDRAAEAQTEAAAELPPAAEPVAEPEGHLAQVRVATATGPAIAPVPASLPPGDPAAPMAIQPIADATPSPAPANDGTVLTVATSAVAGASMMSFVSLLGQQENPAVLTLVGTAGAVIGGGTAWGLSRFGLRLEPVEAAWYTTVTGWGTLAGLAGYAGSGLDSYKARYGLLVAGETVGIAAGLWSAKRYDWTAGQIVYANSLLLGEALTMGGVRRVQGKPFAITRTAAIGAVPAMFVAAAGARLVDPSADDLHLIGVSAASAAWNGWLFSSGLLDEPNLTGPRGLGGMMLGLGAGYLGSSVAAAFLELEPERVWAAAALMGAGNLLGYGAHMAGDPGRPGTWSLGAGLGGAVLQASALALYPHVDPGRSAFTMSLTGGLLGAGSWYVASNASHAGGWDAKALARRRGGMIAGSVGGALVGLVASDGFEPSFGEGMAALSASGLGIAAGLGAARLGWEHKGDADFYGTLLGSSLGLATGALALSNTELTGADLWAGAAGLGYGALLGSLAPSLGEPRFDAGRRGQGGALLGLSLGGFGALTAAHLADASGAEVNVPVFAGLFGLGIGWGTGLMLPGEGQRAARVGAFAGAPGLAALALLAEPGLKLSEGLGPNAFGLATWGALLGAGMGTATAGLVDDSGIYSRTPAHQLGGGALAGASAGMAAGLVLSKFARPEPGDYPLTAATSGLGALLGSGVAQLGFEHRGRPDSVGLLAGSLGGLALGAATAHWSELGGADLYAGTTGLGYGALLGTLAPTLGDEEWDGGRLARGGAMVGTSIGALGAATASRLLDASGAQVNVPAAAGLFGMGAGLGVGLAWRGESLQPARVGVFAGALGLQAAALAADPWLGFSEGLGPAAPRLFVNGMALGAIDGLFAAGLASESGLVLSTSGRQLGGGLLAGAAIGGATGLALSQRFEPGSGAIARAWAGNLLGASLGLGIAQLAVPDAGRGDSLGLFAGSLVGLAAGAATSRAQPSGADVFAGTFGLGYGALAGTLLPTLGREQWDGGRLARGGALAGLALGAAGAATASRLTNASAAEVGVPVTAGLFGLGMGVGAGLAWPTESLQPARIGAFSGLVGLPALALLAEPHLRLSEGLGESAEGLALLGGAIGAVYGVLLTDALEPSGRASTVPVRQRWGGALFGASAGMAAGLALSPRFDLNGGTGLVLTSSAALGGMFGRGLELVASPRSGRAAPLLSLGGSALGLAAGAAAQRVSPLGGADALAATVGFGYGGLLGPIVPTLGEERWSLGRIETGSALLGMSAGAFGAVALRKATGADASDVGLAALGGFDGGLLGLGAGMLVDEPGSQPERIGLTAGTALGLAIGSALWPRIALTSSDRRFVTAGTLLGGWYGALLPTLGTASWDDFEGRRISGGLLAGAGAASFLTSLMASEIEVDPDGLGDALAGFALASGAGAGLGALASRRDDVPIGTMLGGGALGLALGGALHRQIEIDDEDAPLLTLASLQGVWVGGWLPFALQPSTRVTGRQVVGGLAGTGLASATGAWLLSTQIELSEHDARTAGLASALGSAIAGGFALMEPELHGQNGSWLVLGGSTLGLAGGLLLAPRLDFGEGSGGAGFLGGLLGASEALTFAWAGRASEPYEWAGAALVGTSVGVTLGLAAKVSPHFTLEMAPAAAGFSAWGAWMGAFTGGFVSPDRHDVTGGALLGANAGFLTGYGLMRTGLVEPRDIGWLSLFGGGGTLLGAGVGAIFSSRDDPRPVLLGSAVGPAAGLLIGGMLLPKLRGLEVLGWAPSAPERDEARVAGGPLSRALATSAGIADWTPMVGALSAPLGEGEAPMVFGVTGRLR